MLNRCVCVCVGMKKKNVVATEIALDFGGGLNLFF